LEDPKIGFSVKHCFNPRIRFRETSSVSNHQQFKSHHGKISRIQVPLVVGTRAFMQAAKKDSIFVIYATPITELVKGLEALPIRYKQYQDVFFFKECRYASSTPSV
jgi:hypothetical protein